MRVGHLHDRDRRRGAAGAGAGERAEMAGAELADEVDHRRALRRPGGRRAAVPGRRGRPRHQGEHAADDGRARHRGARAARDRDDRRGARGRSRTASSSPTGPATRRRPTDQVALLQDALGRGVPYFGICFGNQLFGRALGFGTYKLQVRPPRHQPAGAWTARPARSRSPRTTTVSPSTPRSTRPTDDAVRRGEVSHVCLNDDVVEGLRAARRDGRLRRSRCSTTRRRRPARTTRRTCSTGSCDLMVSSALDRPTHGGALMPRRDDIESVLVIGSGPIVIGQACEFDYSGTQACRVLKERGPAGRSWSTPTRRRS